MSSGRVQIYSSTGMLYWLLEARCCLMQREMHADRHLHINSTNLFDLFAQAPSAFPRSLPRCEVLQY